MADRSIDADVLVAGGGIQGLTLLHELAAAGVRRAFLAAGGELGSGETLHSHGSMHRGYTMSAAGASAAPLVRELKEAAAWWSGRIRPPYDPGPAVYFAVPSGAAADRACSFWLAAGTPSRS